MNYEDIIDERFDLMIPNHVVEHVPDVIYWLNQLEGVLKQGSHVFLSVPDKRYTFDIIRNTTTFTDLIRINDQKLRKPTCYHILDHMYHHKSIRASEIWGGDEYFIPTKYR